MQATADGEFYPEKDLDRSYRIPRRGSNNIAEEGNPGRTMQRFSKPNQIETPLADSYYNYPYDPKAATAYYEYQDSGNQVGNTSGQGYPRSGEFGPRRGVKRHANFPNSYPRPLNINPIPPPPPPPLMATGVEPIKRNIFDTLNAIRERPKTYGNNIYHKNQDTDQGSNNQYYNDNRSKYYGFANNQSGNNQNFNRGGFGNQHFNRQNALPSNDGYNEQNDNYNEQSDNNRRFDQNNYDRGYNNKGYNNKRFGTQTFQKQPYKKPFRKPERPPPVEQIAPDTLDSTLPKELKMLFQPLFCKLCTAQLSSTQAAKMHYKSKNHEKKIRKWLVEYSEKTATPLHKRALVTPNEKKDEGAEKNPGWFHCEVCDLELTGRMHAESHYMGKNHQKAVLGHKTPSGNGYYKNGKWVRIKNKKPTAYDFEKGEDNFGMDFKQTEEKGVSGANAVGDPSDFDGPPAKKKKDKDVPTNFPCDVCGINTTCQDQLDSHLRGQKHAKKLKLLGLDICPEQINVDESSDLAVVTASSCTSEPAVQPDLNLLVYRTPSGDYYCPTCNITTNSEVQFIQHMKSKGHAKKATQKKQKPASN